ncbi:MAG: hypothetical protein ACP6IT_09895, partial [Candidatus Thorarchaeota archaeon]
MGILLLSVIGISMMIEPQQAARMLQSDESDNTVTAEPTTGTGGPAVKDDMVPEIRFSTASTIDYVDSNYAGNYGTVVNFANMQSADSSYATLNEQATQYTLLEYRYSWTSWPGPGWLEVSSPEGRKDFEYVSVGGHGDDSTYAGVLGEPDTQQDKSGILQSPVYDMYGVEKFRFSVYLLDKRQTISSANIDVQFKASDGSWIKMFDIDDCDPPTTGSWRYKELIVTDSRFLHSQFQIRYYAHDVKSGGIAPNGPGDLWDMVGVDDHKVERGTTHRFDQFFEFTDIAAPQSYSIERLYIDFAYSESESIKVSVWDWSEGRWAPIGTKSGSGLSYWNVHDYLTQ